MSLRLLSRWGRGRGFASFLQDPKSIDPVKALNPRNRFSIAVGKDAKSRVSVR